MRYYAVGERVISSGKNVVDPNARSRFSTQYHYGLFGSPEDAAKKCRELWEQEKEDSLGFHTFIDANAYETGMWYVVRSRAHSGEVVSYTLKPVLADIGTYLLNEHFCCGNTDSGCATIVFLKELEDGVVRFVVRYETPDDTWDETYVWTLKLDACYDSFDAIHFKKNYFDEELFPW